MIEPSFADFEARYETGAATLWMRLVGDLETPVSAYLKLSAGRRGGAFLLESVEGGAVRGRYSMIGLDPDVVWRCFGDRAEINTDALAEPEAFSPCPEPPLAALRKLIVESQLSMDETLPPMAAGVFGYLGYDMVRQMEDLAPPNPDPIGVPVASMIRPTVMVVFDSVKDEISVVTPVRKKAGVSAHAAFEQGCERIEAIVAILEGPLTQVAADADPHLNVAHP